MRRNKAKKRKTESMHVELKSSSEVRCEFFLTIVIVIGGEGLSLE